MQRNDKFHGIQDYHNFEQLNFLGEPAHVLFHYQFFFQRRGLVKILIILMVCLCLHRKFGNFMKEIGKLGVFGNFFASITYWKFMKYSIVVVVFEIATEFFCITTIF